MGSGWKKNGFRQRGIPSRLTIHGNLCTFRGSGDGQPGERSVDFSDLSFDVCGHRFAQLT
jgi:hypothetical protein